MQRKRHHYFHKSRFTAFKGVRAVQDDARFKKIQTEKLIYLIVDYNIPKTKEFYLGRGP